MYCALKLKGDQHCDADIPKSVFSYWPKFNKDLSSCDIGSDCNISITLRNKVGSRGNVRGIILIFPKDHFNDGSICLISSTLLDETNPLSTTFTGEYKKATNACILIKYDGVDNVYVDCGVKLLLDRRKELDWVFAIFSKPVYPGECLAFRFAFCSNTLFHFDRNGTWHFAQYFLCIDKLKNVFSEKSLLEYEIPMLTNYDEKHNGGFDIFYYVAEELKGDEFETSPIARLSLNYNYLGEKTHYTLKKYSWPVYRLIGIPAEKPTALQAGRGIFINGLFYQRVTKGKIFIMGNVNANNGGVAIVGDTINSEITTNSRNTQDNSALIFEKVNIIIENLEKDLATNDTLAKENKEILKQYVDMLKIQAPTKNKTLLKTTLEGLLEGLKIAGDIAPSVPGMIEAIKSLF